MVWYTANMAKLYFSYSAMNAGKSTLLLQVAHNYEERGMQVLIFTAELDTRSEDAVVSSRLGIKRPAHTYTHGEDLYQKIATMCETTSQSYQAVLIDEAQWLDAKQVDQLAQIVDTLSITVMCYGLRTDFKGELFPGAERLLALADELREIRTICHCGRKATMTLRVSETGKAMQEGPQTEVGGNDRYVSVCRRHWKEAFNNN